ncbi:MAG: thioredoxin [Planctomycetes bacterium DG_23]|nr:MAG: thioredoxin [Planctomycetes bacterium DG_23]
MSQPVHTNRLIGSTSPYLLQHAHNPVDWYPWSDEALERAKKEDKPIFLSIGYSACHWCHVMERESFDNQEIARIMNEHFVSIKVDREEHPELDRVYMDAVQLMTGSGGWPLNVFLTPQLKPFYGGTYFPPQDRPGLPGLRGVLLAVAQAYQEKRKDIEKNSRLIVEALNSSMEAPVATTEALDLGLIEKAVTDLSRMFDAEWGGFGEAPKFPRPTALRLLLRDYHRTGSEEALRMVTVTLDRMAYGGMYDQLGGGFHRYSVDREWLVPHFEKMLYDNAQLAAVYLEAYQLTQKPLYREVARETLDYVLREMTAPAGGFYSTQDADSEGVEGKYYVWSLNEIKEILSDEDAAIFINYYGVTEKGNFEGQNILHIPKPPEEFARQVGISLEELEARLAEGGKRLLAERAQRIPPGKDDKVLADWNGLMISAFAQGYQVLGEDKYLQAAEGAADFILAHMRKEGRLLHTHREGTSHIDAFLDDYAFFAQGLIDLYEATFDVKWVREASALADEMIELFWDEEASGFYLSAKGRTRVIARSKKGYDGAVPSANAVAALTLLRLAKLTDNKDYFAKAQKTLLAFAATAQRVPAEFAGLLSALDFYLGPTREIVIAGSLGEENTTKLLQAVHRRYLPNKVVAVTDPASSAATGETLPLLEGKGMIGGKPTAYVCEGSKCYAPVTSVSALEKILGGR